MSDAPAPAPSRAWTLAVVRGALAIVPAIVITFSQDHSPALGLVVFGVWAVVSGLVVGALASRVLAPDAAEPAPGASGASRHGIRPFFVGSAVVTVVAGLIALTLPAGLGALVYLVSVWAAITALLDVLGGLRARPDALAREWIVAGALTGVLALVFALVPLDPVTAVGLLGGYLVIVGVFLVIGGVSAKPARAARPASSPASGSEPTP